MRLATGDGNESMHYKFFLFSIEVKSEGTSFASYATKNFLFEKPHSYYSTSIVVFKFKLKCFKFLSSHVSTFPKKFKEAVSYMVLR